MKTKCSGSGLRLCFRHLLGMGILLSLAWAQIASSQTCSIYSATGGINSWPQGRVPYYFKSGVTDSVKQAVLAAMSDWMDSGGAIAFVEEPSLAKTGSKKPYLTVDIGGSNESLVGPRVPTTLTVVQSMVRGAHSHATHELGHALGYPHEQARPDRDSFVTVHFNKITNDKWHNFEMVSWDCWPPGVLLTPYDYDSIMHYDWCLGSIPGCSKAVKGKDDVMTAADSFWQYRMGGWIGNDGASFSSADRHRAEVVFGKAVWVDKTSGCTFSDGRRTCDVLGFIGPYKTIPDAIAPQPELYIPGLTGRPTLMVRTGTYSRGTTGPLKISKAMKIVAWEHPIRIQ